MPAMIGITVLVGTIITVAFAMLIGSAILGKLQAIVPELNLSTDANNTVNTMFDTVWASMPILPLVVLVLIGGTVLAAIAWFRA